MNQLKLEWKLSNEPLADIGFAIARTVATTVLEQMPDLADMFPYKNNWELQGYVDESNGWLAVRITDCPVSGVPAFGKLGKDELESLKTKVLSFSIKSYLDLYELLGGEWFSPKRFTYVGPYKASYACWPDLNQHLVDWLNHLVLPEVLGRNQARILRAIPQPPQFELEAIRRLCWILECEESCRQGTAFQLFGTGIVTCSHVIGPKTVAFRPDNPSRKQPIKIVAENETIDLAIIRVGEDMPDGLSKGSADTLKVMDHLVVAGFPNYRLGDTGIIIPGLVVGFRTESGIRRILTNAPIVAGTSGGPVLGVGNRVIGVAVTGSDKMESAHETEGHGIIPIDALQYLPNYTN